MPGGARPRTPQHSSAVRASNKRRALANELKRAKSKLRARDQAFGRLEPMRHDEAATFRGNAKALSSGQRSDKSVTDLAVAKAAFAVTSADAQLATGLKFDSFKRSRWIAASCLDSGAARSIKEVLSAPAPFKVPSIRVFGPAYSSAPLGSWTCIVGDVILA